MNGLRVAAGLELPIELVGESTAILAKKGAGKSNTAKVIVEETLDHGGVQVVVLDPIGHWWSLRAGANGKPGGGYPVAVFGGMHGDLPLEETAGRLLARTTVESGQSIVLDVSSLESNGAMQRFVFEFLEELYTLKQKTPSPLLLVLEEADEFAPQDPKGANVPRMVGAANRISKRGRGRGIGMLYVTQRSAALNKNVLDQSDTLIVMRTIGPRDRSAIEGWVKHQDAQGVDEVLPSLPNLETGEAWVWTPERQLLKRVKVRKARTFDSSRTPRAGETAVVATVKPIDVDALGAAIAATVERAKASDPKELQKRIRELEAREQEITALERKASNLEGKIALLERATHEPEIIEVPVLTDEERELVSGVARTIKESLASAEQASDTLVELLADIAKRIDQRPPRNREELPRPRTPPSVTQQAEPAAAARPAPRSAPLSATAVIDGELSLRATRVLTVLGQFPEGRTPKQLAVLSGYKAGGSSYRGALAELRNRGYATAAGVEPIQATPDGLAVAPAEALPTGRELYDYWMNELSLRARRVLELLYHAWPNGLTPEEIAAGAGYEQGGSSYRGALAELRSRDLATPAGVNPIKASDELMEGA